LIWTILGEYIEQQGIDIESIKEIAKSNLKTEWGI